MSYFWSSTGPGYIEPKRQQQLIGVIDFIQPFLIQTMDKPKSTPSTTTVTKILKNGTIKTEQHYKTGYTLNDITIKVLDAYDEIPGASLNSAHKLYRILTDGGYTLLSNDIGPARHQLRFPTFKILELLPQPKPRQIAEANAVVSAIGGAATALLGGDFGDALSAVSTGLEFLNPSVAGVYTIQDPIISDVDFGGGLAYSGDSFVEISMTIKHSGFKYEKSII